MAFVVLVVVLVLILAVTMMSNFAPSQCARRCARATNVISKAVVGLVMKAGGSLRQGRFVPFGPFLAGGGVVVMLAGLETVLGWIGWA